MKKYALLAGLISLMLIIGMALISCGGAGPSSVVKSLHTAIEKGDTKAINNLATTETAQLLAMLGDKGKGALAEKGGITKAEETITGDTAVVNVTYKNGETEKFDLVKEDGKWKVSMKK